MTDGVINSVDEVTGEWLTAVLSKSGALSAGAVAEFDVDTGGGNWSSNARLHVRYSPEARGPRPQRLFLKMVNTDLGDDEYFGPSEVAYYLHDYIDVPDAPLVRCYDGAYSASYHRYHVLLDDLTESHTDAAGKEPTLEYGLALAESVAILHARWWGAQRLAEADAPIHSAAHIQRFVGIAAPGVDHILPEVSGELEPHWPDMIRALFANHPQAIIDRTADSNGFTLIHGDAGEYNILVPREGDRPIYLIDRQPFDWSLTTWLGAYDLAYAMVADWTVETRRQWEMPVLRRYHQQLVGRSIIDYPWQRLIDDYRLCVAMVVYIATEYSRGSFNQPAMRYWLPMLCRALTACDDLKCNELW